MNLNLRQLTDRRKKIADDAVVTIVHGGLTAKVSLKETLEMIAGAGFEFKLKKLSPSHTSLTVYGQGDTLDFDILTGIQ